MMLVALGSWAIVVLLGAAWTGPASPHRRRAIYLALAGLPAALTLPSDAIVVRFVFACLLALALGRALDLALRRHTLGFAGRVWMYVALFDVRRSRRVAPSLDRGELAWMVGHAALVVVGWQGVFGGDPLAADARGWIDWVVRWAFGVPLCYGLVEAVHAALRIGYRAIGVELPRINDRPIVSTTLVEFWGRRWNRVVATWLRDYAYLPLARRRRVGLGIAAAFAASTTLHLWTAAVPLGWRGGLTMASFFVVQGLALALERRIGVARWPLALRRTWTVGLVVASSPLFIEPMLQILAALR